MNEVPIFDSLTHPMPSGGWIRVQEEGSNFIESLLDDMALHNIKWAFAVGMGKAIGGYREDDYAAFVRSRSNNLYPVAFVEFDGLKNNAAVREYIRKLKRLGYVGIKIHPRLSGIRLSNAILPALIKEANNHDLVVLLCTYFWDANESSYSNSPEGLHLLLCEVPSEKIVLLHGGGVRLLEVMEIARQFKNTMLDLSFTLCKYEGSSLDMDIRYLFENFDRRICIGSDSPEIDLGYFRQRFESLVDGLHEEKIHNIAYCNLQKYTGLGA